MHPEVGEGACSMTAHAVTKSQPQTTRTMSLMLHLYRRGDLGCTTRFFTKVSNVCKGRCLGRRRDASVPSIKGLDKGCGTVFFTKAPSFCKGRCLGMHRDASVPLMRGLDKGGTRKFFSEVSDFMGRAHRHQVLGLRSCAW